MIYGFHHTCFYLDVSSQVQQIAQAAQQLQQLQKAQQQNSSQHNTSIPSNTQLPQTQTTPPNNSHIPASLLTPSTPSSGGLTPQHLKTPSRLLEPSPEETTDLEELEQFAKTFKQRRIKLGKSGSESRFQISTSNLFKGLLKATSAWRWVNFTGTTSPKRRYRGSKL